VGAVDERPAKRVMGRHRGGSSAERAAILRDLDEEIRRRDDELRLTKQEVGGSAPDTTRPRPPAPRVRGPAAEDSSITAEELGAGLFKLAGRVEALEESLRETRRQNGEVRAEQDPLKGRLAALEKAFETGAQGLAGMIERLSARLDTAIGELKRDQRAPRNSLNAIRDSHQQTRDQHERELRALRESVTKRLTRLEEIVVGGDGDHGAVEKRLRKTLAKLSARTQLAEMIETQLAATIEKLTDQFESLDARLRRAEERAVAEDEPLTDGGARNADDDLEPIGGRLDLNDASCDQLRELGLSVTQATRLIAQREAHGRFTSTGELDQVPGFAAPQLEELKRRVYVEPAANR
jgi:DNA uptake protein ComE-like DNA-binding protein